MIAMVCKKPEKDVNVGNNMPKNSRTVNGVPINNICEHDRYLFNRVSNSSNHYQGDYKRVLCVCSAGLLRSPTTAVVLSKPPFNYNTRAAGLHKEYALVTVDEVLLRWAQEIVCMTAEQERTLKEKVAEIGKQTPVICLDIPDSFAYRDPKLMKMIKSQYVKLTKSSEVKDEAK